MLVRLAAIAVAVVLTGCTADPPLTQPSPLDALVSAAANRLATADPVAATKWINHSPVEDPGRVTQVLNTVSAAAVERHTDPAFVRRVFSDQIAATEGVEYRLFAQWKFDSAAAPTSAPDLAASRAGIDALNTTMVEQIATHWDLMHSAGCTAALRDAIANVVDGQHLDTLHGDALAVATRSYCPST